MGRVFFCPVSGKHIGNGGAVITPYFTKKRQWMFTYYAFGKNHTISLNTALGKKLKEEAKRRSNEYSNLKPMEALLKYAHAQDNESEFAITDEEWEHFIKEMKEKEKKEMEKEKEKLSSVRRSGRKTKLTINLVGNIQW